MIKRKIKAIADNGELKLKITINYSCEGLMIVESKSKVEQIKDSLHKMLMERFHNSEIKIE